MKLFIVYLAFCFKRQAWLINGNTIDMDRTNIEMTSANWVIICLLLSKWTVRDVSKKWCLSKQKNTNSII